MSDIPDWLGTLVDTVTACMESHDLMGPLGFRWLHEDDVWGVIVYPTSGELVGGADDGTVVFPGFSLDVQELACAFEDVEDLRWQAHGFGPHDKIGPHIAIEGTYQGHHVFMQILCDAPEDEEPRFKVDVSGGAS